MATGAIASISEHLKNICGENKQPHIDSQERSQVNVETKSAVASIKVLTHPFFSFWADPHSNAGKKSKRAQLHMAKETWRGDDSAQSMATKLRAGR